MNVALRDIQKVYFVPEGAVVNDALFKHAAEERSVILWEAYLREHKPKLLAVARPHQLVATGQKVVLDGSRSWSAGGKLASYDWKFYAVAGSTFSDGGSSECH